MAPEDWSLIRTNYCLSSKKSSSSKKRNWKTRKSPKNLIQTNRSQTTIRNVRMSMSQTRCRNWRTMIQCCGLIRVARSQSLRRCALGLHRDRHDAHFRRHHFLAGYGLWADFLLVDTAALDVSCVDTDHYPDPGSRGCHMKQCRQIELMNYSSEGCNGPARIAAGRASAVVQFAAGFSGRDTPQRSCRLSGGTGPVRHPGVCAGC